LPDIEIAAVANSTLASAEAFCAELAPEARAVKKWEELVKLPELDAVWIGATPQLHEICTVAALAEGKHVFCQARMARSLAEAESMHTAAVAHPELVTMLCPPPQGMRGDLFIKQLLDEEAIGKVRTVRLLSLNGAFLDTAKPAHWRQRREISGANIMTLGIHTEVLQRWFGDFTPTHAQGKVFVPERTGYRVEIPDVLTVLTEFYSGAVGTLSFSGVHAGAPVERLEISGESGVLIYDYINEEITLQRGADSSELLHVPAHLVREWQVEADFVNAVRDPAAARPHPDFTDGLRYMRVVQMVDDLLGETADK
jgi:predicted dehydrogenase